MKRILPAVFIAFLASSAFAAAKLEVTTDRPDALYKKGEMVSFQIALADDGKPLAGREIEYVISKDGLGKISEGKLKSTDKPQIVKGKLDEPGFLRCVVSSDDGGKKISAIGGAGIDPLQIKASLPPPDDFGAFWDAQKKLIASEPAKPELTKVDSKNAAIEAFDVQINCPGGAPVSAYFVRPMGAKPKSLPAILYTHSAGVRSSDLPQAIRGASLGAIAMDLNAHGIPNGKPDAFYQDLADGALKGYAGRGLDNRDTMYFRGVFLRLMRAMDFLAAQPEWDGKTLIVFGSSQGGGQALVAAGIDSRVTLCCASVPALCDHTAAAVDRIAGWPKMVPRDSAGKPNSKAMEVSRYFDAANFATRIKCPVIVSVGFIDHVCPPSSVYAAYNNIHSEKQIVNRIGMSHSFPPEVQKIFVDLVVKHIKASKKD